MGRGKGGQRYRLQICSISGSPKAKVAFIYKHGLSDFTRQLSAVSCQSAPKKPWGYCSTFHSNLTQRKGLPARNSQVPYYGKLIGKLVEYAHGITGTAYAVDESTIFIKNFSYDGTGPVASKTRFSGLETPPGHLLKAISSPTLRTTRAESVHYHTTFLAPTLYRSSCLSIKPESNDAAAPSLSAWASNDQHRDNAWAFWNNILASRKTE
uniref:DM13 domain-containing protein n=1 Tax=Timema bartmani TaxID=61472 RepID=A0A7R9ESI8_9NEOP|nr:unnamed protein product [Timema bartmani]